MKTCVCVAVATLLIAAPAVAQDADEMARKLQDPLASIKALMTDNGIEFNTGDDDVKSYSFQLQPVYAMSFEKFNFISRAVIPILGIAGGGQKPGIGEPVPPSDSRTWGLSDSQLQFFVSPKSDSKWKWGVGPSFSLPTHTSDALTGAGWGAGAVGVLVGSLSESVSVSLIGGQMWGEQDGFSTFFVQPMVFYNVPSMPGVAINYNNTISYNWNATAGNEWTVPLGAGISKTIAFQSGLGLDLSLGYYYNVARPKGAADSVIKWGVTLLFP